MGPEYQIGKLRKNQFTYRLKSCCIVIRRIRPAVNRILKNLRVFAYIWPHL